MKQLILAMSLVFMVIGTEAYSDPSTTPEFTVQCQEPAWPACIDASISDENNLEDVLILAKSQDFFKCLDQCAKTRYNCEKSNNEKDKPGTRKNWEESSKCQVKYTDCMDKCE